MIVGVCSSSQHFPIFLTFSAVFSDVWRRVGRAEIIFFRTFHSTGIISTLKTLLDLWKNPDFSHLGKPWEKNSLTVSDDPGVVGRVPSTCRAQGLPNGSLSRWSFSGGGRRRGCETNEGPGDRQPV